MILIVLTGRHVTDANLVQKSEQTGTGKNDENILKRQMIKTDILKDR